MLKLEQTDHLIFERCPFFRFCLSNLLFSRGGAMQKVLDFPLKNFLESRFRFYYCLPFLTLLSFENMF